ncbi:hypothetical protein [Sulfitobacter sp. MF3-043]|uniref:hypothetical protein n=1 Tax=Sulfitobacter sediminivivens TaxID=3252902 RepID=UPI003EB73BF8
MSDPFQRSVGETAFVEAAFKVPSLTVSTGTLMISAAVILTSAIAMGCTGQFPTNVSLPFWFFLVMIILFTRLIAVWGIVGKVRFAGKWHQPELIGDLPTVLQSFKDAPALIAIALTSLLVSSAFIRLVTCVATLVGPTLFMN